jgi:DNA primase
MAKQCAIAGQMMLPSLGNKLALSAESLRRFGVGWLASEGCSTWPVHNAAGKIIGINRRFADGSKKIVWGQKSGLYLPIDLPSDLSGLTLLVCEGATDAVAATDFGLWAIGRFSCTHGTNLLVKLVSRMKPTRLVLMGDADGPGLRGVESLASVLLAYVRQLKVVFPLEPHKDLRAWKQAGATFDDLMRAIDAARARRLDVEVRRG